MRRDTRPSRRVSKSRHRPPPHRRPQTMPGSSYRTGSAGAPPGGTVGTEVEPVPFSIENRMIHWVLGQLEPKASSISRSLKTRTSTASPVARAEPDRVTAAPMPEGARRAYQVSSGSSPSASQVPSDAGPSYENPLCTYEYQTSFPLASVPVRKLAPPAPSNCRPSAPTIRATCTSPGRTGHPHRRVRRLVVAVAVERRAPLGGARVEPVRRVAVHRPAGVHSIAPSSIRSRPQPPVPHGSRRSSSAASTAAPRSASSPRGASGHRVVEVWRWKAPR